MKSSFNMRVAERGVGELAVSIRRHGLLHPIIVRPSGQVFELVAGHRRLEACRTLGWEEVSCVVRNLSDKEAYELALTENVQRKTLDAVEEAEAYKRYVNDQGWGSVSDLARKIGKSEEYVSHRLLLLRLPSEILEKLRTEQLTPWQAQELVWLDDPSLATELSHSIVAHKFTVKQIRNVRRKIRDGSSIKDAVGQVIHRSDWTRGEGSVEAF
ncbi:MAG: ParB/RepB/Spo0J family partition protein, partial [Aigarchaeota archaeon]|nr:ParB/RepB/Spo0J family partition protein [Aigarchaeota archaeon]